MFARADDNTDGVLTADEIKKAAAAQPQPPPTRPRRRPRRRGPRRSAARDPLFTALDQDGDGAFSADEIAAAAGLAEEARRQRRRLIGTGGSLRRPGRGDRLHETRDQLPESQVRPSRRCDGRRAWVHAAPAAVTRSTTRTCSARRWTSPSSRRSRRRARRRRRGGPRSHRSRREDPQRLRPGQRVQPLVRDARTGRCRVSPELYDVLALFDTWRDRSGGALDASAETVSRVWKRAASLETPAVRRRDRAGGRTGAAAALAARSGRAHRDAPRRRARHPEFVHQELHRRSRGRGRAGRRDRRARVVVNVGGDIVTRGDWTETVGVTDPLDNADNAAPMARLTVRDRAVATSGSYRRGFDIDGRHYSHIVDPRTGRPTSHVISATVVADRAADAGALATAFCVLSPGRQRAARRVGAGRASSSSCSPTAAGSQAPDGGCCPPTRQPRLQIPSPVASLYAAAQVGKPEHELAVNVELAQVQAQGGARIERPYLAIWIEDKDKIPGPHADRPLSHERSALPG